jgi:hypothetical protein
MMDKSLFIFILMGVGAVYFIKGFIGDIQKEETLQSNQYHQEMQDNAYCKTDSIGRDVLDTSEASDQVKIEVWDRSALKKEFLALFPHFDAMKTFIGERVLDEVLQRKIDAVLCEVEDGYFAGNLTAEKAKQRLSSFK